ncbi:hypothetical protein CKO12_04580 [Chromatium okenii]|uniref:translocation/assembly module TamB domain-containing protein n=1 Tax=Chromatium okenii TaxID=61644 RepID=UPI001908EA58|nr:translocation/assembly module TamB domain-containing protein [Chromatium okenii]MBK1641160.1 hypothetical protein [Chromatium okenii]
MTAAAAPAPAAVPPRIDRSGRWRWWRHVVLTISGRLLLASGIMLLTTQTGLRLLCASAEALFPAQLHIAGADGRVIGHWQLHGVTVNLPTATLQFGSVGVDWSALSLFTGILHLDQLTLTDVSVTLLPSPAPAVPFALPSLRLPFPLEVTQATLTNLRVQPVAPAAPFQLQHLRLAAQWQDTQLTIRHLIAQLPASALTVSASGQLTVTGDYPLALDVGWELSPNTPHHWRGYGHGTGDVQHLRLALTTSGAITAQITGQVDALLTAPTWEGAITLEPLALVSLEPTLPPLTVQGQLTTRGTLTAADVSGQLTLHHSEWGGADLALDLGWQPAELTLRTVQLTQQVPPAAAALTPALLRLTGQIALTSPTPHAQLRGEWQALRWPLQGASLLTSAQGVVTLAGTPTALDYQVTATALLPTLTPGEVPLPAQLAISGTVREQQVTVTALQVETGAGAVRGQGSLVLMPQPRWTAQLEWTDFDPGVIAAEWRGRISGRLTTQGQLPATTEPTAVLMSTLQLEQLSGTLRGAPVTAAGTVTLDGDMLRFTEVTAQLGSSRLRVDGMATTAGVSDLTLALTAPDLAQVWPGASGRVTVNGRWRGALTAPQITFAVDAAEVQLAGQQVKRLVGSGDLDLSGAGRVAVTVDGTALQLGTQSWTHLTLRGSGQRTTQQWQMTLTGAKRALEVVATGALLPAGGWRGTVTRAHWLAPETGRWQLQQPLTVEWQAPQVTATPLCVRHEGGSRGCVTLTMQTAQDWAATLEVPRLEMEVVRALVPPPLHLEGALDAHGVVQAVAGKLTGSWRGRWQRGLVRSGGETFDLSGTALTAALTAAGLTAQIAVPVKELGTVTAELALPGWVPAAPLRDEQPLRGKMQVQVLTLARLEPLVPALAQLRGTLTAEMTLAGTVAAPALRGSAQVRELNVEMTGLGLALTEGALTLTTPLPNQVAVSGQALLGGGLVTLTGDGRWSRSDWQLQLAASGERLQVANTKEYFALVSPQLTLEVGATGATLGGEIRVPEARIRPRTLPVGTVTASPDIVLTTAKPSSPLPLRLDLRVILGQKVTLDGFGVRGRLLGAVRVAQVPGQALTGDGQVQIVDGQYQLSSALGMAAAELGAPLTILQGRLIFAKSALDDPGLLLQAERQGGATSAGVRVLGTLRTPHLAFFSDSDPNMTSAQMTKYLMTGIAPADDDRAQDPNLALGTYLTPDLYGEYETGFGHAPNKMRLRYNLSRRIEIETETGAQNSVDVYFKFEH